MRIVSYAQCTMRLRTQYTSRWSLYIYLYYQTSKLNKVQWQKGWSKCFNTISWPSECMVHPAHPIRISTHVACLSLNQLLCAEIKTRPSCAWHVGPLALKRVIICSLICYCQVKLIIRCNVNYQRTNWRVNKCIHPSVLQEYSVIP